MKMYGFQKTCALKGNLKNAKNHLQHYCITSFKVAKLSPCKVLPYNSNKHQHYIRRCHSDGFYKPPWWYIKCRSHATNQLFVCLESSPVSLVKLPVLYSIIYVYVYIYIHSVTVRFSRMEGIFNELSQLHVRTTNSSM